MVFRYIPYLGSWTLRDSEMIVKNFKDEKWLSRRARRMRDDVTLDETT